MSCRLIRDARADVKAIHWRRAGTPEGPNAESAERPKRLYTDSAPEVFEESSSIQIQEVERRIAEAHQRGLNEGETAATARLAGQVNAKLELLGRSIEQLAMHRARIQREAEPELVRLSLAIARRIVRRELSVDPESLQGLLKVGLEKIEAGEVHRVRVHPEHAGVVRRLLEGAARPIEVAADPGLPVGAVIFETSRGSIDTGMETQLKEIERGFTDLYPR